MQKLKEGGWPGGPIPYGYRKENDGLVQYPQEAEVVKLIFDMYLQEDVLATTIVRYLNDNGYTRVIISCFCQSRLIVLDYGEKTEHIEI